MLKTKDPGFKNQMITDNEPVIQLRRKSYHVIKVLNIISIDNSKNAAVCGVLKFKMSVLENFLIL